MKKKQSKNIKLINHITQSSKYKIIFILSICVAVYGSLVLGADQKDFLFSILVAHTSPYFNILFFSLMTFNTINASSIILNNQNYMLRIKDKRTLLKDLVKLILQINIVWLMSFILLYFLFLNASQFQYIYQKPFLDYNITTLSYSIFYLIRYYLYSLIFQMMNTIILYKLKEKKTLLIDFIFITLFYFFKPTQEIISKFLILPWSYYNIIHYKNFQLELIYSIQFLLILLICLLLLFYLSRKKFVIHKYFFYYDKNYINKKQKKIILLLIFLPLLITMIKLNDDKLGLVILQKSLGLKTEDNTYDIMSYLMYFFNIICLLYISIKSYISNYKTNLYQIYLRLDYKKFYPIKTYNMLINTFLIKAIQYLFILILLLLTNHFKGINISILKLFITDFLFIVLLQQILLVGYILIYIVKKLKYLIFVVALISILLIPKNIVALENYYLILISLVGLFVFINKKVNKKYHKRIIQEIGGV